MISEISENSHLEPGDVMLKALKAKFPSPKGKKVKKSEKRKKTEKESKKKKKKNSKSSKTVEIGPDVDLGLESSGSSPSSLTLTSSRDSGHASDSNSASRDSENDEKIKQKTKAQKLSSRVAFFENAIKTAAVTAVSRKDENGTPTRHQKEAEFLRAVEATPVKFPSRSESTEFSEYSGSSSDDTEEPTDPAVEEPKFGTLFLSERDLKMEKKLIKQVAGEIEENGLGGVKKMIRKKMNKWKSEPINIAVMGDSLSGKSSVVKSLGGTLSSPSKLTGRIHSCHKPTECKSTLSDSFSLWELPPMSGKFVRKTYLEKVEAEKFDLFLICSPTWFKTDQIEIAKEIFEKLKVNVIFVRTKLDDSIINDRKSKPSSHDEDAVSTKVRNHCWESISNGGISSSPLFLISAFHLNRYDGPKLISSMRKLIERKDKKKFAIQDAMTMSLPAVSLESISRKREILLERIWKVSAISTISGIMPIPGYNLTADIDLLQKELKFFRNQLGISDEVLSSSSNCPNLIEVWSLLCSGNGLISLLRQSAMDQQWEEFSKFMNKLPLIGGNCSFAATCSVLKYCLSELCAISIRYNELEIRKML